VAWVGGGQAEPLTPIAGTTRRRAEDALPRPVTCVSLCHRFTRGYRQYEGHRGRRRRPPVAESAPNQSGWGFVGTEDGEWFHVGCRSEIQCVESIEERDRRPIPSVPRARSQSARAPSRGPSTASSMSAAVAGSPNSKGSTRPIVLMQSSSARSASSRRWRPNESLDVSGRSRATVGSPHVHSATILRRCPLPGLDAETIGRSLHAASGRARHPSVCWGSSPLGIYGIRCG
jgi:hypothetical protein